MKPPKKTSGKLLPVQKKKPGKTKAQNLKEPGSKLAQSPVALRVLLAHLVHLVRLEQLAQKWQATDEAVAWLETLLEDRDALELLRAAATQT